MPRTKAPRKKPVDKPCEYAASIINVIENAKKDSLFRYEGDHMMFMSKCKAQLNESKLGISSVLLNRTMGELSERPLNWTGSNTCMSVAEVLDATKTLTERKKKPVLRSSSVGDEGYLTAESSNGHSGGRKSRTVNRTRTLGRPSRSLSTRKTKTIADKYKTPSNKIPPTTYGTVTPKVKPNIPQVVLRRPKQGELALSLQGSPLMTGSVMTDNIANINIPLEDGNLLAIQPHRGLRLSQIPQFDPEIRRQLEALRDNLNKVCAISAAR